MNYRPDESILISWLYGELDEVEKEKVEKYFQENPEELKKMQQLHGVKDIMSNIQDKEVIAPPLFMDDVNDDNNDSKERSTKVISFWNTTSFKTVISIAASFLLLIVAGKLLNMDVSYSNSELRISFGEKKEVSTGLTALDVQKMIDDSNSKDQQSFEQKLIASRTELDEKIKAVVSSSASTERMVKKLSTASNDEIRSFVATLQKENLTQMQNYLQLSSADQRKYTDNLVVEFSKYLQEQRNQDLNMFQTRFSKLEQHTDELKTETEQILASIISSTPQQTQQSSY